MFSNVNAKECGIVNTRLDNANCIAKEEKC